MSSQSVHAATTRATTRRTVLTALVALPSLPALAAAAVRIDPKITGADFGVLYRKLRYRADDGALFWWLSGTKYANRGNEVIPIHNLEACAIIRINTTNSGFSVRSLEHIFYTDLKSGRPLTTMRNPLTDEIVEYKRTPARPIVIEYRPDATFDVPSIMGESRVDFARTAAVLKVNGNEVWMQDDTQTTISSTSGSVNRATDWSTFRCNMIELLDPKNAIPAATVQMQSVSSWQPWMKMGDRPGGLVSRTVGAKVTKFSDVSAEWRSLIQEFHPDVARDPLGALGA